MANGITPFNFDNKVVIVTGSSSGLGAETAVLFASLGASVTLTGRNEENLRKVAGRCVESGSEEKKLNIIVADVTNEDDCLRIVDSTIKKFGTVHILVNNAGEYYGGTFEQMNVEDLDAMVSINLKSHILITKKALPELIKSKGCIVNNSSEVSLRPMTFVHAYSMCKAALNNHTQALALELGPKGVRANAVVASDNFSASVADTPMHTRPRTGFPPEMTPAINSANTKVNPLGRICEPLDVARAIAFLASDWAAFINGAILPVDGGHSLTYNMPQL